MTAACKTNAFNIDNKLHPTDGPSNTQPPWMDDNQDNVGDAGSCSMHANRYKLTWDAGDQCAAMLMTSLMNTDHQMDTDLLHPTRWRDMRTSNITLRRFLELNSSVREGRRHDVMNLHGWTARLKGAARWLCCAAMHFHKPSAMQARQQSSHRPTKTHVLH